MLTMLYSFDLSNFEAGKFTATRYPRNSAVGGDWVCRAKSDASALRQARRAARYEWAAPDHRGVNAFTVDFVDSAAMDDAEVKGVGYKIANPNGLNGPAWDSTYSTRGAAVAAIAFAYQMAESHLSEPFPDEDDDEESDEVHTAWSVYETEEERDRDDTGAEAPRVVAVDLEEEEESDDEDEDE